MGATKFSRRKVYIAYKKECTVAFAMICGFLIDQFVIDADISRSGSVPPVVVLRLCT